MEFFKIALKGMAMGAADVVPGVSGGTIALLTGIYSRLIDAITRFNPQAAKLLFQGRFKQLWQHVDGSFLLPLAVGILFAFVAFAHTIKHSIETYPVLTWSFFFGLIIASALLIIKNLENKQWQKALWLIPGVCIGFWIASLSSIPFPSGQWAVFIAAMIAISAMILPGISGSFILLLLGMYQPVITAVAERDYVTIGLFGLGAVAGLMLFSRVVQWILKHFYQATLFFLSGLMLGSLVKIWPWKSELASQTRNIMPTQHPDPQTFYCVLLMLAAFVLVFGIDFLGKKISHKNA